jgi:hypothetical protein
MKRTPGRILPAALVALGLGAVPVQAMVPARGSRVAEKAFRSEQMGVFLTLTFSLTLYGL